jgi:hypothetical protein
VLPPVVEEDPSTPANRDLVDVIDLEKIYHRSRQVTFEGVRGDFVPPAGIIFDVLET